MFPGLVCKPDPDDKHFVVGDDLRLVGPVVFTSGGAEERPMLECDYAIKVIVPRAFPTQLPRVYSTDGQILKDYHTNPTGDLCLGPPLQLHAILREEPSLIGYFVGAVVPYLYRHRYTVLHGGEDPPGWTDLAHGAPGLLDYYEAELDVRGYRACLALLRHAGQKQRTGRRAPCPCGSGRSLNACHYKRMAALRQSAGRAAVWRAYLDLLEQGPPRG